MPEHSANARRPGACRVANSEPLDDLANQIVALGSFRNTGPSENLETRPVAPASPWSSGVAARLGHVRRGTFPRVRWWAIAMTGIEASTSPPALPRWFGPRASEDDPAVSALIARVARGAGWADIGGE